MSDGLDLDNITISSFAFTFKQQSFNNKRLGCCMHLRQEFLLIGGACKEQEEPLCLLPRPRSSLAEKSSGLTGKYFSINDSSFRLLSTCRQINVKLMSNCISIYLSDK